MAEPMQMVIAWLVTSGLLCIMCLCLAGLAYSDRDRKGVRAALRTASLAWTWPVAIPAGIFYGIWKMYRYASDGSY